MPDNFEDIIKRLRQCRQKINSSSGATGHLKTLEKIVFKAEKSLRRIHDPNSRSALANTVGAKRKLRFNNLKRFIEKNRQLEYDIKQGESGKSTEENIEAAENVSSFYSSTSSETLQNHNTSTENHAPKLVKAIKGAKTEFFMEGTAATNLLPEIKSSFKNAVAVNIIHRNEHKNALHIRNKWADKYGINVSNLTKSDYLHTLEHAKDKGMISDGGTGHRCHNESKR
mgnify:CR=1 FL=1